MKNVSRETKTTKNTNNLYKNKTQTSDISTKTNKTRVKNDRLDKAPKSTKTDKADNPQKNTKVSEIHTKSQVGEIYTNQDHPSAQKPKIKDIKIPQDHPNYGKINILDFLPHELEDEIKPKYKITQIFQWIYQKYADDFTQMTSLAKPLRDELAQKYHFSPMQIAHKQHSKDGSIKYLFRLNDGLFIESVLLPMKKEEQDEDGKIIKEARYTICISSQVGCRSGCKFCLTAKGGLTRNLSAGEIAGQILFIKKDNNLPYEKRINIVYMGMGEPLDNLENVSKAIQIISHNDALGISPRRQSVSTSGLSKQIKELGKLNLGVLLAISLHAVDDELRSELMPINKAYNIQSVLDAVREFPIAQRKRVMFEYLCIKDKNDQIKHAKALVKLLHGIKAKVNLIFFNPSEGMPYQRPSVESVEAFRDYLQKHGITASIRESKGLDISAACGQLKEQKQSGKI